MGSSAPSQSATAIHTRRIISLVEIKCFWGPQLKYRTHFITETVRQEQVFKIKVHSTFKTKDKLCNK